VSPPTYEWVRSVIGEAEHEGELVTTVDRPSEDEPTMDDLQRAASLVAQIVLRLHAIGMLQPDEDDANDVKAARRFIGAMDPASREAVRTASPDRGVP
jgi:hypothetical protein